jgi:uncharacterized protein
MDSWVATGIIDEKGLIVSGGLLIGAAFGYCAQLSGFCIRSAVCNAVNRKSNHACIAWILAVSVAFAILQLLVALDCLDISSARQLTTRGTISGAVFGGLLLGMGIVTARGCPCRLLVLLSQGNLRALLTLSVIAASVNSATNGAL